MAALPYLQFYPADYLADTQHLTLEEHGAYLLLILNYWQTGKPVRTDVERLSRVCSTSVENMNRIKPVLAEFFNEIPSECGNFTLWRHERIELDLQKVLSRSLKASRAGKKSAAQRAEKNKKSNERSNERTNHTDTDTDTDTDKTKRRTDRNHAARPMQEGWQPDQRALDYIAKFGVTRQQAAPIIHEFYTYWRARSTKRKDWSLAFVRNSRVETSLIRLRDGGNGNGGGKSATTRFKENLQNA